MSNVYKLASAERALEARYQDGLDRADEQARLLREATEMAALQLRAALLCGMQNPMAATVPFAVIDDKHDRICQEPHAETVAELLDEAVVIEAMTAMFQHSECPWVRAVRKTMGDTLAQKRAADMAMVVVGSEQ